MRESSQGLVSAPRPASKPERSIKWIWSRFGIAGKVDYRFAFAFSQREKGVGTRTNRDQPMVATETSADSGTRLQITRVMSSAAGVPWQNFVSADSIRSR